MRKYRSTCELMHKILEVCVEEQGGYTNLLREITTNWPLLQRYLRLLGAAGMLNIHASKKKFSFKTTAKGRRFSQYLRSLIEAKARLERLETQQMREVQTVALTV